MGRQRSESTWWLDPSQVFTDTQRVDLFNDPPWVTAPHPAPRREAHDAPIDTAKVAIAKAAAVRRVLMKRGHHRRSLA